MVDRVADAVKRSLPVRPAEEIVAARMVSAAGLDNREARKKPPVETVLVGFRNEESGICFRRTAIFFKKFAEDCFPQVELFTDFSNVLIGIGSSCRYTQDSGENHQTRWQKALHSMSFSFEI